MKKILALLIIPVLLAVLVTPALAQESAIFTTDLIADGRGEAPVVGTFSIDADGTITFQIDEASTQWRLEETHLYVGDEPPASSAPGRFPYKHEDLGGVASDAYAADLAAADVDGDGTVYVAAHAGLTMQVGEDPETGEPIYAEETAWAQGDQAIGKGKNWATCFSVTLPVAE